MGKTIEIQENGIYLRFEVTQDGCLKLVHFSAKPFAEEEFARQQLEEGFSFVQIDLAGYNRPHERYGNKFTGTAPGYRMKYEGHEDQRNGLGRCLVFHTADEVTNVKVSSFLQFYDGLSVMRCWNEVKNEGDSAQTLTYIANFHYEGLDKGGERSSGEKMKVWIPYNGWQRELNWKSYSFSLLGMDQVQPAGAQRSSNFLHVSNTGNWSTKEYLPMGYVENEEAGAGWFWQIEHNGSWEWEIGDRFGHFYLALGGPNEVYSHWYKELKPGDSFTTVPAAVGVSGQGMEAAVQTLTAYRRIIRRKNRDNERLPVIFNDYMNCLWGRPQAKEEFPLVDAAAEAGCEIFCIDCGWYADGGWWDNVGEWEESRLRFPNGLKEVTDYIRKKGMIPGLWLEPEVMGIHCSLAGQLPDDQFFVRHGRRVYDKSRFQLDYRNPEVRKRMDSVVDRLVREYGVGYIKMDYNIEPGIGTELAADSCGDGLLGHERSYLAWLDGLWERYPELIIENCSSGGMRMDYAMLSRCSIQSTSDQDDYLKYAVIAANAPTGAAPEQAAVWAYPMNHEGEVSEERLYEETIFNMVNAMLLRIHQSGHLAKLDAERKALVEEGIRVYRQIREEIPQALPFWPLGLADYADSWVSLGLLGEKRAFVAVWKRGEGPAAQKFPLPGTLRRRAAREGRALSARCIYPAAGDVDYRYDPAENVLTVETEKEIMARVFEIG